MEIGSASGAAMAGISTGMTAMRQNAAEIASTSVAGANADTRTRTDAQVELQANERQVEASAKAAAAADQTIGSLLNVTA